MRLGPPARDLLADPANDVLVSVVSLWDIQVKVRAGKLTADLPAILREIEAQAFELLPMTPAHLGLLGTLAAHHQDPFNHLLIAQALMEAAAFVSEDGRVLASWCAGGEVLAGRIAGGPVHTDAGARLLLWVLFRVGWKQGRSVVRCRPACLRIPASPKSDAGYEWVLTMSPWLHRCAAHSKKGAWRVNHPELLLRFECAVARSDATRATLSVMSAC